MQVVLCSVMLHCIYTKMPAGEDEREAHRPPCLPTVIFPSSFPKQMEETASITYHSLLAETQTRFFSLFQRTLFFSSQQAEWHADTFFQLCHGACSFGENVLQLSLPCLHFQSCKGKTLLTILSVSVMQMSKSMSNSAVLVVPWGP